MKTFFTLSFFLVLTTLSALAQTPRKMHYQGVLNDQNGNPINGVRSVEFRLYDTLETGTPLWSQGPQNEQMNRGMFNAVLGPFPEEIDFSIQYYLELVVEGDVLSPREALASAPYALRSAKSDSSKHANKSNHANNSDHANNSEHSKHADVADSLADNSVTSDMIVDGTIQFIDIGQNSAVTGQVIKWDGTIWVASNDDIGAGGSSLPITGGIMTGPISNSGDPEITMGKGNFGQGNLNPGLWSFVAGSNNRNWGSFSVISGGGGPTLADSNFTNGFFTTIGGGTRNRILSNFFSDSGSTIGGGTRNRIIYSGGTIGGGMENIINGFKCTIGGGDKNAANGEFSVIGGGYSNTARGIYAIVGGGYRNAAKGSYSVVAGGGGEGEEFNLAEGNYSTISGGHGNNIHFHGENSTISGGANNFAIGENSTISGGFNNKTEVDMCTIGGGLDNVAKARGTTIGGGIGNVAGISGNIWGLYSTIPGGFHNRTRGLLSFAAGHYALAQHKGSFVWADAFNYQDPVIEQFSSERDNQFRIRANGGARFDVNGNRWVNIYMDNTNLISTSTGATLTLGGVWTNTSDKNLKENFTPIDKKMILEKLTSLPITRWNYKSESPSVKHIGPTAQDFYGLFGLGADDISISTIDPSGIALVAIQQLKEENNSLREEIDLIKKQVKQLMDFNNFSYDNQSAKNSDEEFFVNK